MNTKTQNTVVTPYYFVPNPMYTMPNPYAGAYISNDPGNHQNSKKNRRTKFSQEIYEKAFNLKKTVVEKLEKLLVDLEVDHAGALEIPAIVKENFSGDELFVIGCGSFHDNKDNTWEFRQPSTRVVMQRLDDGQDPWFIVKVSYHDGYERVDGMINSHLVTHTFIERPDKNKEEVEEDV